MNKYAQWFIKAGMLKQAQDWLTENPPPNKWKSSKYAWAYEEMVIQFDIKLPPPVSRPFDRPELDRRESSNE